MSKLQKKKTFTEKKKRKEDGVTAEGAAPAQAVRPASPVPAAKPKVAGGDASVASANLFARAADFLREVKVELKKVTWPTRKQTTGTTIVVIVFVFVVAIFLGLFDYSLSRLVQVVLT